MPIVRFLATRDGKVAASLPPLDLSPEQTSAEGLREAFFEQTGQRAYVLHDDGIGFGLEKDHYLVRLERTLADAADTYPPLEHARTWQQPGWFRETLRWLENTFGETVSAVRQVSTNDLACVTRVETENRIVYLKASETGLEAALSAHLADRYPELTPNVVAWDEHRHLLVTEDCGVRLSESSDVDVWHIAVENLAHFQRVADAHVFRALGCPVYTFTDLADRAETFTFLRDADALHRWGLTAPQVSALAERIPYVRHAHERVSAFGLPLLPAHGDAHPMNALTGCRVWFDWSEACVAHPLLDVGWLLAREKLLPPRQTYPDVAATLWQTYLRIFHLPKTTDLDDVVTLALIHRALVYHEKFGSWQGTVPGWRPEYVPYFLRCLLKLPL